MLACFVIIAGIPATGGTKVREEENVISQEYEIYPVPRDITYKEAMMEISDTPNLVMEDTVDSSTEDRLTSVLESKEITGTVSDNVVCGKTNILVGTKGSGGAADQWFDENDV